MFCPRCSAQNEVEQKYCRHCGLPLTTVRLALEGRVEEGVTKYDKAIDWLVCSLIAVGICILNVLATVLFGDGPRNYGTAVYLILGIFVSLPMVITGLRRLESAQHLLKPNTPPPGLTKGQADRQVLPGDDQSVLMPAAPATDPFAQRPISAVSVTEHTTLDLKKRE